MPFRRPRHHHYDGLGRHVEHEDADGNKTETTYDAYGRPVTVADAVGRGPSPTTPSREYRRSSRSQAVGTVTARYDADGDLVETTLPNGLSQRTSYNAVGESMTLAYTKASSTWYEETAERDAEGRILSDVNTQT